jgi:hypothetical protein
MGAIEIKISKEDLIHYLQNKINDAPNKTSELVQNLLNDYMNIATVEAPSITGELRESTTYDLITPFNGVVYATAPQFDYVIQGTPPHSIGSSVFMVGIGWRYIGLSPSGAGNIHPGTKANDYMQTAYDSGEGNVDSQLTAYLDWFVE